MAEPTPFLLGLRASTADLLTGLAALHWSDADVAAPSLCEGWTRGHVLTHLARNADGMSDTLAGALRGEIVELYPGGRAARDAAIEAGAQRPFAALVADVRDSASRLDRVLGAVGDADGWELPTTRSRPAEAWVYRRWREVEIHRVDLDAGYTPDRWPARFVSALLSSETESLVSRVSGAVRVEITSDGSLAAEHVGRTWTAGGSQEPLDVHGPDWAVAAWLVGRPSVAANALSATPRLAPWR